jgi:hypothetical protein
MSKFISHWFYASLGTFDVEKGMFFKKTEKHHSERYVNLDQYAEKLRKTYEDFDAKGYEVVEVTPIVMGQSEASIGRTKQVFSETNYLGDVGFSITRGAVIIGKLRE